MHQTQRKVVVGFGKAFTLCLLVSGSVSASDANLTVTVDNIKQNKGVVRVGVYDATTWLDEGNALAGRIYDLAKREGDEPVVVNFQLEPGEYGAVVYHDVNANQEFDRNFIGIPKEPYAFSRDFSKLRRPKFEDCKFVVGEDGTAITLTLNK